MKKEYIKPDAEMHSISIEHSVLITFSQVDNDGDGITDQRPIIEGDPDGGIGAKKGWSPDNFDSNPGGYNSWED